MNGLATFLMVSILSAPTAESRYPMATEVFHCAFENTCDLNFDLWPDKWVRRRGPKYPHWVSMEICSDPVPIGGRCLRVDLDGGAASAHSPPIVADPLFDYVLEAYVQTEGLRHNQAYVSMTFLDKDRHPRKMFVSKKVGNTNGWVRIRLGPVTPSLENARFAVVGVHVEPGKRADLTGTIRFGDLWLARMPRMTFTADRPHHLYPVGTPVTVTASVSGLSDRNVPIRFTLEDVFGKQISTHERPLPTQAVIDDDPLSNTTASMNEPRWIGSVSWQPPIPGPGFYRVKASMSEDGPRQHRRALSLTVIEPQAPPVESVFGWSLARGGQPLELTDSSRLILQSGVRRVKFPFWIDRTAEPEYAEQADRFAEQLSDQGVRIIGLLNVPPESVRRQFDHPQTLSAAELFTATPDIWLPSLVEMQAHSSIRIDWWQLGNDTDRSFVRYPNLSQQIESTKLALSRLGTDMKVGFAWGWMDEYPLADKEIAPWRFLALSANPPLTYRELNHYGSRTTPTGPERWLTLHPLPAERYSIGVRVEDLIRRMMTAQKLEVEGIFASETPNRNDGLLQPDGTPNELFLPWRTTALLLGGSHYRGSVRLPHNSENHIFARDGQAVMIVFNQQILEEPIHVGTDIRQVNPWGIHTLPVRKGSRHLLQVGGLPSFVTGVNESLIRWRQQVAIKGNQILGDLDKSHSIRVELTNTFPRGVSGQIDVIAPDGWKILPSRVPFRMAAGETLDVPLEIQLPFQATSARHPIDLDFQVHADRAHAFRVPRHIDLGPPDVEIKIRSSLNDRGELVVEQRFVHTSDPPIRFRCYLYAPGRMLHETQVVDLRRGEDLKTYRLPDGRLLLGKELRLKAEEVGGESRVLNYRFQAEK